MRRACKHPLNSAKPLQQLHRRSETDCPSFRTARILSSSLEALCSLRLMQLREQIALHVVHHARLACQNSAMLPLAKKIPYVTRPASCSHSGMFAVTVARRHRIPFSIFSVNIITPSPSCRLWSRSAAGLPTALSRCLGLNRKAFHPSVLTQASGRVPAFRRAESGGTKLRDSAL